MVDFRAGLAPRPQIYAESFRDPSSESRESLIAAAKSLLVPAIVPPVVPAVLPTVAVVLTAVLIVMAVVLASIGAATRA